MLIEDIIDQEGKENVNGSKSMLYFFNGFKRKEIKE